jgi:hypothetical protein
MNHAYDPNEYVREIAHMASRLRSLPLVFPMKIAGIIRDALRDPHNKLAMPHWDYPGAKIEQDIRTVGDCRYAMTIIDANGTRYRVTVEVEPKPAGGEGE